MQSPQAPSSETVTAPARPGTKPAADRYRDERRAHWEGIAASIPRRHGWGGVYRRRVIEVYRTLIPEGRRVLEIGCGQGGLLAALKPSVGVGVDFSPGMIALARGQHPDLTFVEADAHDFALPDPEQAFDAIILSDLIGDLWDVQRVLTRVAACCAPHTRIIINSYSRVWQWPLTLGRRMNRATGMLRQNWIVRNDLDNLLMLAGLEPMRHWTEVLCPVRIPLIDRLCNRFLVKLWPMRHLAMTNFTVARPQPDPSRVPQRPVVSVVVPARNEAGNIRRIIETTPEMLGGTELIFVEGGSSDDTWQTIRDEVAKSGRRCEVMQQTGKGKGDAVRLGFSKAHGDILTILDADLTVPPEDLPRFMEVLTSGKGEFVNGVRLVYPMEGEAMRPLNFLGNKFFGWAFTWLLGQPIKDTLCGTKVVWKHDYERIVANRGYFGDFDPYGDFDLIFGAAKLNLKIVDMPVRYRARTYGDTNINRWTGGMLLLRMTLFAARRLKFV